MERRPITSDAAPAAIGPYSQAIRAGDFVFLSGQIPLGPKSGQLEGGDDIRAQTEQVMSNLAAVLTSAGSSFARVVKTTIFLTDLNDFTTVNQVYGKHFEGTTAPARSTVQVAALPRGAKIEIEMIALAG